jgi:hypothetical protein
MAMCLGGPPGAAPLALMRVVHENHSRHEAMGQNNDPTEHGDLQGQQGGNLSKNPQVHENERQDEEGYAGARHPPRPATEPRRSDSG